MFKRKTSYHEGLLPYLEGGLDEAQKAQMQARLAADPALAAEAERLRRTLGHLRQSAERAPQTDSSAVPADLWPRLRQRLEPAPPPRRPAPVWWMAGVGAAAALGLAAIWLPIHTLPGEMMVPRPKQTASAFPKPNAAWSVLKASPAPTGRAKNMTASAKPPPSGLSNPFALPGAAPPASPRVMHPVAVPAPPPASAQSAAKPAPSEKPTLMTSRDIQTRGTEGAASVSLYSAPAPTAAPETPAPAPAAVTESPPPSPLPKPAPPPVLPTPASAPVPAVSAMGRMAPVRNEAAGMASGASVPAPLPAVPVRRAEVSARDSISAQTEQQTKSQPNNLYQFPGLVFGQSGTTPDTSGHTHVHGSDQNQAGLSVDGIKRRDKFAAAKKAAPANRQEASADADQHLPPQGMDQWQASLAAAVQPPLLGENAGEQQANQALMATRESGGLEALRARLEAGRSQSPSDIVTARMLAAVYEFGFSDAPALRERRRLVGLDGATGEDWFALGEAEARAGNGQAAREAYKCALDAPAPLSSYHAALARQRS